jgi:hypothetical protein
MQGQNEPEKHSKDFPARKSTKSAVRITTRDSEKDRGSLLHNLRIMTVSRPSSAEDLILWFICSTDSKNIAADVCPFLLDDRAADSRNIAAHVALDDNITANRQSTPLRAFLTISVFP